MINFTFYHEVHESCMESSLEKVAKVHSSSELSSGRRASFSSIVKGIRGDLTNERTDSFDEKADDTFV